MNEKEKMAFCEVMANWSSFRVALESAASGVRRGESLTQQSKLDVSETLDQLQKRTEVSLQGLRHQVREKAWKALNLDGGFAKPSALRAQGSPVDSFEASLLP